MNDRDGAQRPTIYDVAEAAGVSISTVSNTLNRPDRVGAATRKRILDAADQLGYTPNAAAASLARATTRRLAVFGPFSSYLAAQRRLMGALAAGGERGLEIVAFDTQSAAALEAPVLGSLPIQDRFDGVIVMGLGLEGHLEQRFLDRHLPVVVVDAASTVFPSIVTDDVAAGRLVAEHLLELGHRRVAFVAEQQVADYESQSLQRLSGFRARFAEEAGTTLLELEAQPTPDATGDAVRDTLESADRPTAVVVHFDLMAVGVLRAARARGIQVPDELSVVTFDDGPVADAAELTAVSQPFEESGRMAVQLLADAGSRTMPIASRIELPLALVVRGSSAPAPS